MWERPEEGKGIGAALRGSRLGIGREREFDSGGEKDGQHNTINVVYKKKV